MISTPATATTFTATYASAAAPVPVAGLVGHWPFDEASGSTAADASGNGNAGVLTYGPTWTSGCAVRGCLSFDGEDDYVKVADTTSLRLTGPVTITAWINPAALGVKQSVVSKRYEFELGWIDSASPYPLKWSHKTASGTLVSGDLVPSTVAGRWQHVALVRAPTSGAIRGFLDGALVSTSSYAAAAGSSNAVNIGRNPGGLQRFKGLIDEVRIYNRALSQEEIAAIAGAR